MMPSLKRYIAGVVATMLITLATLHPTIAQPTNLGEGEATSADTNSGTMRIYLQNDEQPQQFQYINVPYQNLIGKNKQAQDEADDPEANEVSLNDEYRSEDSDYEENQPRTFNLDPSIQILDPKYVVLTQWPLLHSPSSKADENIENANGFVDIPTQDVGEEEQQNMPDDPISANQDEGLIQDQSQNIAYSYSNYFPNYEMPQPQPQHPQFYIDNRVRNLRDHPLAPMSFVFHPTVLRGMQPALVLQELKSFALQLNQSPIMNALFSPSTVPIPQTSPAWPSKYEARRYLPPNSQLQQRPLNIIPNLDTRRSMVQIDTENLDPDVLDKLQQASSQGISDLVQQSMGQHGQNMKNFFSQLQLRQNFVPQGAAMNNFFNNQLQSKTNAISQEFDRNSQQMNNFFGNQLQPYQQAAAAQALQGMNFFNNQLQVPQFPQFPNYQAQSSFPQFPHQNQNIPTQNPYISPSLRQRDTDPTDDIDVRFDKRSDTYDANENKTDLQKEIKVIQIGNGNRNVNNEGLLQMSDETEDNNLDQEDEIQEDKANGMDQTTKTQMNDEDNIDKISFRISNVEQADAPADQASFDGMSVMNQVKETTTEKVEEKTVEAVTKAANLKLDEEVTTENSETTEKISETTTESIETTTEKASQTLNPMNDVPESETFANNILTTTSSPESTTLPDDETTTTELSTETTTFYLDDRLDLNVIKSLAG